MIQPRHMGIISIERAPERVKRQWGPTLFTGLAYYGGDHLALLKKIVGDRDSRRLVEAGALLAMGDAERQAKDGKDEDA